MTRRIFDLLIHVTTLLLSSAFFIAIILIALTTEWAESKSGNATHLPF